MISFEVVLDRPLLPSQRKFSWRPTKLWGSLALQGSKDSRYLSPSSFILLYCSSAFVFCLSNIEAVKLSSDQSSKTHLYAAPCVASEYKSHSLWPLLRFVFRLDYGYHTEHSIRLLGNSNNDTVARFVRMKRRIYPLLLLTGDERSRAHVCVIAIYNSACVITGYV